MILSGGQEVVSLSVAEALYGAGIEYSVLSLTPRSILRGAPGCNRVIDLSAHIQDPVALRSRMCSELADLAHRAGTRLVSFATEDGGLRCLNEFSEVLLPLTEFPRARSLRMGGLDKAELFSALAKSSAARHIPPTMILTDIAEVPEALRKLGPDAILKPALKPWDMDLGRMGAKIVTRLGKQETDSDFLLRVRRAWPLSTRWVAQSRLSRFADGERGVYLVGNGQCYEGMSVVERWKYPKEGGSGCLVEVLPPQSDLLESAAEVLRSLDYVGLAEIGFLVDQNGHPKLLEVNARPWLQIGLAESSGFRVVLESLGAIEQDRRPQAFREARTVWIQFERALAAVVFADAGPRLKAIRELFNALRQGAVIAVYSSPFPGVRLRWLARMARTAALRIFRK